MIKTHDSWYIIYIVIIARPTHLVTVIRATMILNSIDLD